MIRALILFALSVYATCSHHCPPGTWVNGVRPGGAFSCLPMPPSGEVDCTKADVCPQPADDEIPEPVEAEIRCTGGAEAIVVDYRTVGCMRGGWQREGSR